jgi:hypothetical protein
LYLYAAISPTDAVKKLTLLLAASAMYSGILAQTMKKSEVPEPVKTAFERSFKDAKDLEWQKSRHNYVAVFRQEYDDLSVTLSASGEILTIKKTIKTQEIPRAAREHIAEHYQGIEVLKAAIIKYAGGNIVYEAGMKDRTLLFDKDGGFLREETDGTGKEDK